MPNVTILYDFFCIYVPISKNIQQQNVNGWTTSILKILKKVCPIYTDEDYKAAKQHVANSGKDADLPGVYAHRCTRDWLNSKFFKFISILTSTVSTIKCSISVFTVKFKFKLVLSYRFDIVK